MILRAPSIRLGLLLAALGGALSLLPRSQAGGRQLLLVAGPPAELAGTHEFTAGALLLQKCLRGVPGLDTRVALNGWPQDPAAFDQIDAVLFYCEGAKGHLILQDGHRETVQRLADRGVGIGMLHFAVEPTIEQGEAEFIRWIGAAFEVNWSVNPHWHPEFQPLPTHPITRGVRPFRVEDEWYYNLRFTADRKNLLPILVAVPPPSTLARPDGIRSGNPAVRAAVARKEPQILAWAYERADGGRGFGFTAGHYHQSWANDDYRKLVLNALLWLAKVEVPPDGVASVVADADLAANLLPRPKKNAP